jgi:hypothetical protein
MWKMPSPPVVSNNTPLVGLFNLRRLDILTGVYESVAIPRAVEAEFLAIDRADAVRQLFVPPGSLRFGYATPGCHAVTLASTTAKPKCWLSAMSSIRRFSFWTTAKPAASHSAWDSRSPEQPACWLQPRNAASSTP